jgi:membrane protease YdiL (CAAX protease family)
VAAWQGQLRRLLASLRRWRVNPGWYLLALAGPTGLALLAALLGRAVGVAPAGPVLVAPAPMVLMLQAIGPWGEEIGWRGFAQPTVQERIHPLSAAVCVGLMWFGWHHWPVLTPVGADLDLPSDASFLAYLLAASVLLAWLYNRCAGSIPIAWAAHAGLNLNLAAHAPGPLVTLVFVAAAAVVAWRNPRLAVAPPTSVGPSAPQHGPSRGNPPDDRAP